MCLIIFGGTVSSIFSLHTVYEPSWRARRSSNPGVQKNRQKEEQGHSAVDVKECEVDSFQPMGLDQFVFQDKQDTDEEQNYKIYEAKMEEGVEGKQQEESADMKNRGDPECAFNSQACRQGE
jgi:hypothetical protein